MKKLIIIFSSIFLVLSALLVGSYFYVLNYTYAIDQDKVWDLVQSYRQEKGLKPYTKSEILCKIANNRVDEIQYNYSHDGFSSELLKPYENESKYTKIAENLGAENFFTNHESDVLKGWKNSVPHNETLMADYTDSCLKCKGQYCVQLFAK